MLTLVAVNGFKKWNDDPDITRFMKGIYNLRTPVPKYSYTWDVNIVLKFLKNKSPLEDLSFKDITMKAVTLIALSSGQRAQSIHLMKINNMELLDNAFVFHINDITKTLKPGNNNVPIRIQQYLADKDLCVFNVLKHYLKVTQPLRSIDNPFLWISMVKPHSNVTKQTISRWIKTVLKEAGINTNKFSAHSTRMAAVSKANALGVGLETIIKTAGWNNAVNFKKFYLRDQEMETKGAFANAVLELNG